MNDETTRSRLILAARDVFAERGVDAGSVREITARAGANLGAVTYHFGSKDALYEAVVDVVFAGVVTRVRAAHASAAGRPPLERIEAALRALFAAIRDNPDFPIVVLSQAALKHRAPAAALQQVPAMFALLASTIREGQADGTIRTGDAQLMAISLLSQPAYFGIVSQLLLPRLPGVAGPHASWEEISEHAAGFARAALAAGKEQS
jgi:AcrR family transcriptional regulator